MKSFKSALVVTNSRLFTARFGFIVLILAIIGIALTSARIVPSGKVSAQVDPRADRSDPPQSVSDLSVPQVVCGTPPDIYGYNFFNDHLLTFNAATPGTITSDIQLTGLGAGEFLVGIDIRPANGQLYGLATNTIVDRLVTINTTTGVVTGVGGTTPSTADIFFGTDFNPVVDRYRVVGDSDSNRRINPNDGTLVATDTPLAYAAGDPRFGTNPNVVHVAYDRNNAGATLTTLFGIDSGTNSLVRIGGVDGVPSPNTGQLFTIAPLGIDPSSFGGFDIQGGSNNAYAVLRVSSVSTLYTINLTTGAATLVGPIGTAPTIDGIAVIPCTLAPTPTPTPTPTPAPPTVTANFSNLPQNSPTITINGTNFSATPGNNTITFNLGAAGTVTAATSTQLIVTFTTQPNASGPLTAVVTTNGLSSGAPVQVASIVAVPTPTPTPPQCNQNFDQLTPPALPSGWVSSNSGSLPPWVSSNVNPDTAPNDVFLDATNGTNVGNSELITSNFIVNPLGSQVTFRNLYNLSFGFDGAVLEISINGAPFQDIVTAGGSFVTGGYTGLISGAGSPIIGRQAWTGLSGGTQAVPTYLTTTVNLPAAASGQLVRLKFRVATDSSGTAAGAAGVRIDSISGIACTATAANVSISGRILTSDGRGLRNARVLIADQNGVVRSATTSSFGFYQFEDVVSGQNYVISVDSRVYHYDPRPLQITDNLSNVDFVPVQ